MELLNWWWGGQIAATLCYRILLTSFRAFVREAQPLKAPLAEWRVGQLANILKVVLAAVLYRGKHSYHRIFMWLLLRCRCRCCCCYCCCVLLLLLLLLWLLLLFLHFKANGLLCVSVHVRLYDCVPKISPQCLAVLVEHFDAPLTALSVAHQFYLLYKQPSNIRAHKNQISA